MENCMKKDAGKFIKRGNNVYESKGRIYLKELNEIYIVDRQHQKTFSFYQSRFSITVIALILIGFNLGWVIGSIAAACIFVAVELCYRLIFLRSLDVYDGVINQENVYVEDQYRKESFTANIVRLVIAIVFVVLLWYNLFVNIPDLANVQTYINDANKILMLIATLIATALAIKIAYSVIKAMIDKKGSGK